MEKRQQPETLRLRAVMPAMTVDDIAKSVAWYREPTDQPWGARDFAVVDPDGFKISISTGLAE